MMNKYYMIEVRNYYKHITTHYNGLYNISNIYEILTELNYIPASDGETIRILQLLINTGSVVVGDYELTIDWNDLHIIQQLKRELEEINERLKREIEDLN